MGKKPRCEKLQSLMGRLNRLLRFHMKENFSFDTVAKVLFSASAADILDKNRRQNVDLHVCDFCILNAVADFARQHFHVKKIPVQEGALWDFAPYITYRLNLAARQSLQHTDISLDSLKDLGRWFQENCNVEKSDVLPDPTFRCLHENKARDTMDILSAIQHTAFPSSRETEYIPNVISQLFLELTELDAAEFEILIKDCHCLLIENEFSFLPLLWDKLSILYHVLLRQRNWTVKQLICMDEKFLEDYLNELAAQN